MSSLFEALEPNSDATSSDVAASAQQKRDGTYEALEKDERTHDSANQLLGRDTDDDSTDERSYVYDAAGNLREIDKNPVSGTNKHVYTHDAWNRLVKVEFDNGTAKTIGEYEYYGTHWRAVRRADSTADQTVALDQERFLFYDASWRLIEERIDDESSFSGDPTDADIDRHMQYIWGTRYIDDIVCRRENSDFGNDSPSVTYEDEWYHLTDVQFSTVAIIDDTADLVERISYSAYGVARHHHPGDVDGDGDVDSTDSSIISTIESGGQNDIGDSGYIANADLNRDGQILTASDRPGPTTAALGEGYLSSTDNIVGYDGYLFNIETQHYAVRFRCYAPELGRWIERDPVGVRPFGPLGFLWSIVQYADGASLYQYVRSAAVHLVDPFGQQATPPQQCIHITRDDFIKEWKKWHPGLTPAQYQQVEQCIDRGCVGVTCALIGNPGNARGLPDLSNCYETLQQAQAKQADMEATGACANRKNCYDERSKPRMFSVRWWSNGQPYTPDAQTGQIDMSPWRCVARPGFVNFDFGYFDESSGRWYHANHSHDPTGQHGPMTVYCSTLAYYSQPLQDFDKQAFCVACDEWGFGRPGSKPNPTPGPAPWLP